MNINAAFQLGYAIKVHGVQGELLLQLETDNPEEYKLLESVFVDVKSNGKLVPFFIEHLHLQGDRAILKLEDLNNPEDAAALKGCSFYLPLSKLPKLKEEQFYFHEIVGFTVNDQKLGLLGKVENVYALPHQDVIAMNYRETEVLIPINKEVVTGIDRTQQHVFTNMPDGLLDVYFEEDDAD